MKSKPSSPAQHIPPAYAAFKDLLRQVVKPAEKKPSSAPAHGGKG